MKKKRYQKQPVIKKPNINHNIKAEKVRLVDETGQQLGLLSLDEAVQMAKDKGLDLIQVTEKVDPPVCRIMEYGKYLYQQKKKEKTSHHKGGELKGIRLSFGISDHDLETRARQAEKFLRKGDKVKIEMKLRGRERALGQFTREKVNRFIEILSRTIPVKIEGMLKKSPRGLTMIIIYDKQQDISNKEKHENKEIDTKEV